MKRTAIVLSAVLIAAAMNASVLAQGRGRGGTPITTLAGDVQADWARTRQLLQGIAEAMPEDKYSFKPTAPQETFGQRVMHVAQIDTMILQALGGKTAPPTINTKATSKADIVAALKQSFDYGDAVIKEFSDQQWSERVMPPPFMGPSASRLRIIYFSMQHSEDIYGQLVVYLRLSGGTPPASAGRRGGPPEP
jgi:uncharacterized damage-inducible protein DinB